MRGEERTGKYDRVEEEEEYRKGVGQEEELEGRDEENAELKKKETRRNKFNSSNMLYIFLLSRV